MRVLQIGADRSKRGILVLGSLAYVRQKAYAEKLGTLDIIGFSRANDGFSNQHDGALHIYPTRSVSRVFYVFGALRIALQLPRPDVVSVQDPFETGIAGLIIALFSRAPLYVQVHTDVFSPEYARLSPLNRIRVLVARVVLRRAERIRVVSERIQRSIEKIGVTAPITILPIFVDVSRLKGLSTDAELQSRFTHYSHRALYVGRLEPEKNPCLALRAFAEAAPASACLIVVGSGSEETHLKKLAGELGIVERVYFEGEQSAEQYYATVDVVLVTSWYEGYGLVIVEALARGVPVLSTDVGVAREAGAMVAEKDYSAALKEWFVSGARKGELKSFPYLNFNEYVNAYCADVQAAVGH